MKKLLSILLSLTALIGLVACTRDRNKKEFKPKLDVNTACKINVVGHYDNFEALESEFNRFNQYYPNVELTYTKLTGSYGDVILTAISSENENPPDIFFTQPSYIGNSKYNPLFEVAEDLSKKDLGIDLTCIRDELLYKDNNNKVTMLPIYLSTYGMIINEDIFTRYSIQIPKTYDELISACNRLKEAGYIYPVMGHPSMIMYPMYFPHFLAQIKGNQNAISELNDLNPSAGEYMRSSLNLVKDFMDHGFINYEECSGLSNDYDAVIMRFFEGDVPIMLAQGKTVSGTEKREKQSNTFQEHPFKYSFHPVPSTNNGGYFQYEISMSFSVNKNSKNLEMVNEFMRFIVSAEELGNMSKIKRMITPCKDMSFDDMYASLSGIETVNVVEMNLRDAADSMIRTAGRKVCSGEMTVDEAVNSFGE